MTVGSGGGGAVRRAAAAPGSGPDTIEVMTSAGLHDTLCLSAASANLDAHGAAALWALPESAGLALTRLSVRVITVDHALGRVALGEAHAAGLVNLDRPTLIEVAGDGPQTIVDALAGDRDLEANIAAWLTGRLSDDQQTDIADRRGGNPKFVRAALAAGDMSVWCEQLTCAPERVCPLGDRVEQWLHGSRIVAHNPWWVAAAFDQLDARAGDHVGSDRGHRAVPMSLVLLAEWIAGSDDTAVSFGERGPRIAHHPERYGRRAAGLARSNPYLAGSAEAVWRDRYYPTGPDALIAAVAAGSGGLAGRDLWATNAGIRHHPERLAARLRDDLETFETADNSSVELLAATIEASDPELSRSLLLAIGKSGPRTQGGLYGDDGLDLTALLAGADAWRVFTALIAHWEAGPDALVEAVHAITAEPQPA